MGVRPQRALAAHAAGSPGLLSELNGRRHVGRQTARDNPQLPDKPNIPPTFLLCPCTLLAALHVPSPWREPQDCLAAVTTPPHSRVTSAPATPRAVATHGPARRRPRPWALSSSLSRASRPDAACCPRHHTPYEKAHLSFDSHASHAAAHFLLSISMALIPIRSVSLHASK